MIKWFVMALGLACFAFPQVVNAQNKAGKNTSIPAEHCDLDVRVLPDQHRLEATATVRLPFTAEARESLAFDLRSDMEVTQAEVLAPAGSAGAAAIHRVTEGKEAGSSSKWEIRPKRPIPAKTPVTVKVTFAGGKRQGLVFYLGPEGCFAGGANTTWYPRFSELRSVGTLQFTAPTGYVVKASGVAGGEQTAGSEVHSTFTVTTPSLFSFAAGHYVVRHRAGKVPMTLYLLKDRPFADRMVTGCWQVLQVLEKEFGPYPYGEFAVIETPAPQSELSGFGGASLEGFMFVDTGFLAQGFNLALFGHEIGHQWWGNLIKHEGERGAYMLDEAMAQFGSLRCVEALDGAAAAEKYRRSGYPGYLDMQCGRGALLLAAAGVDYPLSQLPSSPNSHAQADSKGFLVYSLLARTIGPDRFRAALKQITTTYGFGTVTWETFLKTVEQTSGQDLGWFYRQWFYRSGAPALTLQWTQDAGTLRAVIHQEAPAYRLSLPLQITLEDGKTVVKEIAVEGEQTELRLSIRQPIRAVTLDPHYEVFHADPALRAEAEALRYYTKGTLQQQEGKLAAALPIFMEGLRALPEHDIYGVEFLLRYQVGGYHRRAGRLEEARHEYELALACPVRPAQELPYIYLRLAQVAKAQGDTARLLWAVHNAESADLALEAPTSAGEEAHQLLPHSVSSN
ncbi:MAG TPA: M1 family aminopeptidase [Chthonomonadaceae bacterium]|nr:M1 family aminopeptidase [Chthonomonadaceae bacterium]